MLDDTDVAAQVVEGNNEIDQVVPDEPTPQQKNFAALREKAENAERRSAENERRAQDAEERLRRLEQLAMSKEPVVEEDTYDFSNAVDAEPIGKLAKSFKDKTKKLDEKIAALEAQTRRANLAAKDPSYVDVINKYLPGILKENPSVKDIIAAAPEAQQFELMYQFATSNKDYVLEKHVKSVKGDTPAVIEEKAKINTLGALKGGTTAVGKESALEMSHEAFYGEGGYLSKILANKIH